MLTPSTRDESLALIGIAAVVAVLCAVVAMQGMAAVEERWEGWVRGW
jgi:hypothetical protein